MATSDRIDPGPGWRLLEAGERKPEGHECYSSGRRKWIPGICVGEVLGPSMRPCRVRISQPRTVRGLATRATVRVVTSALTAEQSIRCDSGLSAQLMEAVNAEFASAVYALRNRAVAPTYIMLEIQRGPNDC